jgi:hypothetical protein
MHKYKKIIFSIVIIGLILCSVGIKDIFAASACTDPGSDACSAPAVYKVTMNKLEMSTTGGATNVVTVVNTAQLFDIASTDAGAVVGSWFAGTSLPFGSYNWMRRTISGTFTLKGFVTLGGNDYYTSSGDAFGTGVNREATGTHTFEGDDIPADYVEVEFDVCDWGATCTAGTMVETDTSQVMNVERNQKLAMQVSFNVANTLGIRLIGVNTYQFELAPPDIAITLAYSEQ